MTENYQVKDLSSLHKYRTETPNIVHDLDLDVYAFRLYSLLKKIAGDGGKCFASNAYLMEKCKMGKDKLIECKKILSSPFGLLKNLPLINIEQRSSPEKGDQPNLITIVDIWLINILYIESIKKEITVSAKTTGGGGQTDRGSRPERHKEEPLAKKNHIQEESLPLTPSLKKTLPPKVEKQEEDEIFFECIKNENLSLHTKRLVCDKYYEDQVKEAWSITKQKCTAEAAREKYFLKVLENPPSPQKKQLSVYEELKQYFKHGGLYRNAECILSSEWIAFRRGMKHEQLEINKYWSWENLQGMCDSFGIKFART